MKKIIFYVVSIIILISVSTILIQLNRNDPAYIIKSLNLQERLTGEPRKTVFRVNFLGFSPFGGIAEINNVGVEAYDGNSVYHLSAQARTEGFISMFFNPKADADTYIDKDNLYSLKFTQVLTLPDKPPEAKEVLYDQKNNIMELKGIKRQILPGTQDPLSAIFYLQHQDFKLGREFDININTNQKNYQLYARVVKKQEYAIGNKKIEVWILEGDIRRRDKNPLHSSKVSLWLLDNPSKTPLLIKFMTNVGVVKAWLIRVE